MKHKALVLKVADYSVVRVFPFEKAYFFHEEMRKTVPRIFRFGLVSPITHPLQGMLQSVKAGSESYKAVGVGEAHPIQRYSPELTQELTTLAPIDSILAHPQMYFMVIPLLVRTGQKALQRTFAYLFPRKMCYSRLHSLSANMGQNVHSRHTREAYIEVFRRISVIFERQEIESPCVFCRRAIYGMAGSCNFGSTTCRESIGFAGDGQFAENVKKFKQTVIDFPDRLKGADHGSVSNH